MPNGQETSEKKPPSEKRWRTARVSLRVHSDLRRGLELLAKRERRSLSQYVELMLVDHAKALFKNPYTDDGSLEGADDQELVLRDPRSR